MNLSGLVEAGSALVSNLVANSGRLGREAARDFDSVRDAAVADWQSLSQLVAASPRVFRATSCALRCAARAKLLGERAHAANAEDIRRLCAELRGGLLKVGQLMSTRGDLLPKVYIEVLAELQDRAPALPIDVIESVVDAELGAPIGELFAAFAPEPLAAASLAQVHAARLHDGREVAVKVMIPGIEARVHADLIALEHIAAAVGGRYLDGIDIAALTRELAIAIGRELDYLAEADQLDRFRVFSETDARWRVPEVVRPLTSRRVLTMERIEGPSLAAYLETATASERDEVVTLLVELIARQFLRHGAVHGDPHPGNIIVEPSGRLALIDFGCVLELTAVERLAFARLIAALVARDRAGMLAALTDAGFRAGSDEAMVELADLFLAALDVDQLASLDPREQLARTTEILAMANGVEVPASFALVGRIFALLGGLVMTASGEGRTLDLGRAVQAALAPPAQ